MHVSISWQRHVVSVIEQSGAVLAPTTSMINSGANIKHIRYSIRYHLLQSLYATFCGMLQGCTAAAMSLNSLGTDFKGKRNEPLFGTKIGILAMHSKYIAVSIQP